MKTVSKLTSKQKKWLLWSGGVLLAYTLLGFLIAPWYIKSTLTDYVSDNTEATLSIERIYLNPFTFYTEAKNISLQQANATELVTVDALQLNLDVTGLIKKTLVLSEFRLLHPSVNIEVDAEGNINLVQALSPKDNASDEEAESSGMNFLLALADIVDGEVSITDNSSKPQRQATIDAINLSLKNITSIRQETGKYDFSLLLGDDTTLNTSGEMMLNPLSVQGGFSLDKIGLDQIHTWAQAYVPIVSADGSFSANGDYSVLLDNETIAFRLDSLSAHLADVSLQDAYTELTTSVEQFFIEDAAYDSQSSLLMLGETALQGLAAKTTAGSDYLSLSALAVSGVELKTNDLQIDAGNVQLSGFSWLPMRPEGPLADIDTLSLQSINYAMTDGVLRVADLQLSGTAARLPVNTSGRLALPPLPLKVLAGPVASNPVQEDTGQSALQQLQIGNTAITELGMTTHTGAANSIAESLLNLGALQVSEFNLDMTGSGLTIKALAVNDTELNLSLDAEQQLNIAQLFASPDTTEQETENTVESDGAPFTYAIGKVTIAGTTLGLQDNGPATPVQHRLTDIDVSVQEISSAAEQRAAFELSANVGEADKGQIALSGSVIPSTLGAQAAINISNLDLAQFNPYLSEATLLKLDAGQLNLSAATEWLPDASGLQLSEGTVQLTNLALSNAASDVTLFGADNIAVNGVGYEASPKKLFIGEVLTMKPYINILINEAGQLNLAQVTKGDAEAPAVARATATEPAMQIEVKSITLEEGGMDFSDQSLVPRFSTKIHGLNGVVNGLSSDQERFATLALTGNVNEFGSTTITGELQPFKIEKQSEIDMEFQNIDTSSLTPYTTKFAGRKIESGSLSLALKYKVNNGKLDGNNNIVLKSLILGERVESPDAMDLPLDMAISLLEDSSGRIDLDVPISGELDNPQFDIASVIQKAVGNLITGIVTSPFQFLGSLLGGDTSDLNIIEFQAGSEKVMPSEAEKLSNLGTALESRPALVLEVTGRYAQARDTKALARHQLREQVAAISEQPVGRINVSDPAKQDILDDLAEQRLDKATREKLESDREQQEKSEEKQVASKAYYDALIEQLVGSYATLITETDLRALATRRAEASKGYLLETKPTLSDRIIISDKVVNKAADTDAITLELEISTVKIK